MRVTLGWRSGMRVRMVGATGVVLVVVMMVGVVMMMVLVGMHVEMAIMDMHMAGMNLYLARFMPDGDCPENHKNQNSNAAAKHPGVKLRSQQIVEHSAAVHLNGNEAEQTRDQNGEQLLCEICTDSFTIVMMVMV